MTDLARRDHDLPVRTVDEQAQPVTITLEVEALHGRYASGLKPILDRIAGVVLLVLFIPVLAVLALVVLVTLGRPVLFIQDRVGRSGHLFPLIKFRTMHPSRRRDEPGAPRRGTERDDRPERRVTHKSEVDPRLTPAGRFMRRMSLDELPQLINVVRGEMSLVGPRPELPSVVDSHYQPWMHRRHAVKPGMTGLWQVSERGNGMMHEHVDVDLDYVDQVSPALDLRILSRTIPAAFLTNRGH